MCLIRLLMSFLMHQGRAMHVCACVRTRRRLFVFERLHVRVRVCMLCYVSLCVDDTPMINLWPHLYAAARQIDGGAGGERKDHAVRAGL